MCIQILNGAAFANQGYPEIVDFGVLEKYRRNGIGSKLMDIAEQISLNMPDIVYLGVGMHSGYGTAQRMYVKRGYILMVPVFGMAIRFANNMPIVKMTMI